jgi:hypothetical protein
MNFIILDTVTGGPLYGIVLLKEIRRTGRATGVGVYRIPAEAWIAFLQVHYSSVPEVRAYLQAVETEGINPRKGAMLEAIDQRVEIPEEELRAAIKSCGAESKDWIGDEGEEWKRGT